MYTKRSHTINQLTFITLLILLLLSLSWHSDAARPRKPRRFPRGCEAIGFRYENNQLILTPSNMENIQTLYLIQNTSGTSLHLKHQEQEDLLVEASWETDLDYRRWAAFASDRKLIHFTCYRHNRREGKHAIDCRDAVEVCQYPRAKFPISNNGSYWVVTNKSLHQTVRNSIKSGILLRW